MITVCHPVDYLELLLVEMELEAHEIRNRPATVNQRAKLTRQPGISALNFDHPG